MAKIPADENGAVVTAIKHPVQVADPHDNGYYERHARERIVLDTQAADTRIGVAVLPSQAGVRRLQLLSDQDVSGVTFELRDDDDTAGGGLGNLLATLVGGAANALVSLELDEIIPPGFNNNRDLHLIPKQALPASGNLTSTVSFTTGNK